MIREDIRSPFGVLALCLVFALAGCTNKTKSSSAAPSAKGVGEQVAQATSNDPSTTVRGAGVGSGVGYVIGDPADKAKAASAKMTPADEMQPLAGTTWTLLNMDPSSAIPMGSMMITFWPDGRAVTTQAYGGETSTVTESYRVVGPTLILNRDNYVVNAPYTVTADQLTLDPPGVHFVFKRVLAPAPQTPQ